MQTYAGSGAAQSPIQVIIDGKPLTTKLFAGAQAEMAVCAAMQKAAH